MRFKPVEILMTTWSKKRNEYFRLKTKIEETKQTLVFLKKCKKARVFPNFIKIKICFRNSMTRKICNDAKKRWLNKEINRHHRDLSAWEKKLYEIHLYVTRECSNNLLYEIWCNKVRNMHEIICNKVIVKRSVLNRKFEWLKRKKPVTVMRKRLDPVFLDDFVINLSTKTLSDDEKSLLNKGLKFILPPTKPPVDDLCVDIMASVRYASNETKNEIENTAERVIRDMLKKGKCKENPKAKKVRKVVKSLRDKKLLFTRADKSNNIIVMENEYYERVVMKVINSGPYVQKHDDPLQDMIKGVDDILEEFKWIICENPRLELRDWKASNPQIPCLYVLLKTHKELDEDGDMKARPVASNTNAPTEAMSKKLSDIFNSLPPPEGRTVKNGTEFANLINGVDVNRTEEMGSYDVSSLYPSVPILFTIDLLMKWLIEVGVGRNVAEAYVKMAKVCMDQNIFLFRGKWYVQFEGTSIGNSLSSFMAEIFMRHFEMKMQRHPQFPRVYFRYIDDIFAIQKARMFNIVKDLFEKFMDSIKKDAIKFTIERQVDAKIPFLNVMCEVKNGVIEVDVYRKPSSTMRLITSDSYHDRRHKASAYHAMAHFMVNIPLSEEKVAIETAKIVEIGKVNGFHESMIMDIINRHREKKLLLNTSTFYDIPNKPEKRIAIRFFPEVTKPLKLIYKKHGMELVHRNDGSLKQALGSVKDKPLDLHMSGIYRIQCHCCGRLYFGMTIRKLFIRFNEHVKSANWKRKTAVGRHIFSASHDVHISELKLIQPITQMWKIEYYEAIHIYRHKHENLLNEDNGNITSPLLDLFTLERVVDENVIDITNDTPNTSIDEESFFDCE